MISKVYHCVDKQMYPFDIRKVGRLKKIYVTSDGEDSFIRWNNRRLYVSSIMRVPYPIFYEDDDGKQGFICGYFSLYQFGGLYVELIDGEYIQLWDEV